jgi:hypothetical protein
MMRHFPAVIVFGLVVAFGAAACEKGPMQRTEDKLIGTGPLEQAGRNVDRAVKDLKKVD